jgi:hypothetical protein
MDDEAVTERIIARIRGEEMHKGGYVTPCDDWVYPDEVHKHAERCAECREVVDA